MLSQSENSILKFIRFAPIVFIFLLSITISYLLILENNKKLENDLNKLENSYIHEQKESVKKEVERVYNYILYQKELSETNLKKQLKSRVYEAHAIATNIYKENKHKSKKEVLKLVQDALRDVRFNEGRGYYFMHTIKGENVLYPPQPAVEWNNYSQLKDINGYYFVQTIMKTIKDKTETFDQYYWSIPADDPRDTTTRIYKKIVFYKYFEPLNISISTGEYIQDYEKTLQKKILNYVSNLSFGKDGYVFIINKKEKILAHINKDLINSYLENFDKIETITKKIVNKAKEGNGFIKYKTIYHDKTKEEIEKTTYIKSFASWDWILGSGFYRDKLDKLIIEKKQELDKYHNDYLFNISIIILIVTTVLLLASFYISNMIQKRFISYRNKIYKEMEKNRKKDSILAQQSKMAAMGEMIGNIAHQWRQPLSLISTASTSLSLKQDLGMLKEEELKEIALTITNTTQHLSKTIDDFRNFFKPNKEKVNTNTKELWEKTASLVESQYASKNIALITKIDNFNIHLLNNELIQVILNILNNAKDELLKLDRRENLYIFISMEKYNEQLKISIKDNAGGIPPNILNRIFEPYFTTKHKAQGTGIGLFMSQEIIKKHMKGTIEASNESFTYEDKKYLGALFSLEVPIN